MRRYLLTIILAYFTIMAQSRDQYIAGFSFNYANINRTGSYYNYYSNTRSYIIEPSIAMLISDNIALGIGISFSSNKDTNGNDIDPKQETKITDFLVIPHMRYFIPLSNNISIDLQTYLSFGTRKYTQPVGPVSEIEASLFNFGLSPGLQFKVTEQFRIELSFGGLYYTKEKTEFNNETDEQETFTFQYNLHNIRFDLLYYF